MSLKKVYRTTGKTSTSLSTKLSTKFSLFLKYGGIYVEDLWKTHAHYRCTCREAQDYLSRSSDTTAQCYFLVRVPKNSRYLRTIHNTSHAITTRFPGSQSYQVTIDFLEWLCERVQVQSKSVLVLIWENASWHLSKQVRTWLREHTQNVLHEAQTGNAGVRIIPCWLPTKSPWLNTIEPAVWSTNVPLSNQLDF